MSHATTAPAAIEESLPRASVSRVDLASSLVAAYTFAIGLPLIDLLRRDVAFFVVRGSPALDYVLFVGAVALLVPACLSLVALLPSGHGRSIVHAVALGGLLGMLGVQLARRVDPSFPLWSVITLAGLLGAVGVLAFWRWDWVRQLCRYASLLPLALVAMFLMASPVRAAMSPQDVTEERISVANPRPVVVVVFDELPLISLLDGDGALNSVRYPNFARLAVRTTWYRNAASAAPSTIEAVPSLLTGRYPAGWNAALPILNAHPNNLFTMLGASHRIRAVEPVTDLCPDSSCPSEAPIATSSRLKTLASDLGILTLHTVLPDALTTGLPAVDDRWGYFGASSSSPTEPDGAVGGSSGAQRSDVMNSIRGHLLEDRVGSFESFVADIEASAEPTLWFIHSLLPHRPWAYMPDGTFYRQIGRVPGIADGVWLDLDWLADQGLQRHLLQVGAADHMIGELLDKLDAEGITDAILVVTADHGIAFEPEAALRAPGPTTEGAIMTVPLFVSVPGRAGEIVDAPVELVDVLPTVAELMEADIESWPVDGHSLLVPDTSDPRMVLHGSEGMVPVTGLEAMRDASEKRLDARVPLGGGWDAMFDVALGQDMRGEPVATFDRGPALGFLAKVDNLASLESGVVDPWPAMVTGHVSGAPDDFEAELAIAFDGTITAVTRTFDQATGAMFSALTRLADVSAQPRQVGIYVIGGSADAPTLSELRVVAADD